MTLPLVNAVLALGVEAVVPPRDLVVCDVIHQLLIELIYLVVVLNGLNSVLVLNRLQVVYELTKVWQLLTLVNDILLLLIR